MVDNDHISKCARGVKIYLLLYNTARPSQLQLSSCVTQARLILLICLSACFLTSSGVLARPNVRLTYAAPINDNDQLLKVDR